MNKKHQSLTKWQGIENHYVVGNFSAVTNKVSETINKLADLKVPDLSSKIVSLVPLVIWYNLNQGSRWLRNGGRALRCGDSLEISTPECQNHYLVAKYDLASDVIAYIASVFTSLELNEDIRVAKRTYEFLEYIYGSHDRKITRGCHESYNSSRSYNQLKDKIIPFCVIRPIFSGSGGYIVVRKNPKFVLSPRIVIRRGVIETTREDEPFSMSGNRLHFVFGELLLNEWTRFINNGLTTYVIIAIEEGIINNVPQLSDVGDQMINISTNTEGEWKIMYNSDKKEDAISFFTHYYLEAIEKLFSDRIVNNWDRLTLEMIKDIVDKFGKGSFETCAKYVQWIEVKHLIENPEKYINFEVLSTQEEKLLERKYGKDWRKIISSYMFTELGSNRITREFIKDHRENGSLHDIVYDSLPGRRLFSKKDIIEAVLNPPEGRAKLRVKILEKFGNVIGYCDWDYLRLKTYESKIIEIKDVDWSDEEIEKKLNELESSTLIN